jgi:hypothetical protein
LGKSVDWADYSCLSQSNVADNRIKKTAGPTAGGFSRRKFTRRIPEWRLGSKNPASAGFAPGAATSSPLWLQFAEPVRESL